MYNIKLLLAEELILNEKKNQLNEHTLMMISDPMYVKHVLGIDVPLNEYYSFELRKKDYRRSVNNARRFGFSQ